MANHNSLKGRICFDILTENNTNICFTKSERQEQKQEIYGLVKEKLGKGMLKINVNISCNFSQCPHSKEDLA
jgi:hypothetical protein